MDIAIFGMGLPSVYIASRLSAEGMSVGLFGKIPDMVSEPVGENTVDEFSLSDFVINKIKYVANFNKDFELDERGVAGSIVSTKRMYWHYLNKAMDYGCEVLEGSTFDAENTVTWNGRTTKINPELTLIEEAEGKPVVTVLAGRVPINFDTVEFYDDPDMWVVPSGKLALIGGKMDFSWHKFERMALLRKYTLSYLRPTGDLVGDTIKIGRAAGHTTKEGFVVEASLHHARLLVDTVISEEDLRIYGKSARPSRKANSLKIWLEA
ncbi:MAG: hypothetical protein GOV01_00045 [Candidatus Altiarchaeota archaeon]|nr:hypothetical protein [Candidatus Altiarchaeota archaeon]